MHVKMKNGLAAVGVCVYNYSIPVLCESLLTGDLGCGEHQVADGLLFPLACCIERVDVDARHEQNVRRCLRADVVEGDASLVLVHPIGRNFASNYLAKQAVIRTHTEEII